LISFCRPSADSITVALFLPEIMGLWPLDINNN
jgi:hypothetical protein